MRANTPEKPDPENVDTPPAPKTVEVVPAPAKTERAALSASVTSGATVDNASVSPEVSKDPVQAAKESCNGDTEAEALLLNVHENTDFTMPTGPAKYMFIAEGIGKAMEENPDLKKSQILQLGYMFCLFFGKLGGFNADADSYSSFVDSIYRDEKMSKEDLQKRFSKDNGSNIALIKDSYLKCKKELAKTEEELNKDPKNEDLKYARNFLDEKRKEYEKKFEEDGIKIAEITQESVKIELSGLMPNYEKKVDFTAEENKKIKEDKKEDFIDSMLSVKYVVNMLGISEVKGNDPDRLYARFLHSKYSIGTETDKPKSPYLHLKDAGSFIKRAENETLAVNTVVFFSHDPNGEGKSFMMAGIVCPDHKIRYQDKDKIQTFNFVNRKDDVDVDLGLGFKGAFEPEDSKYNEDIIARIEEEKAEKEESEEKATADAATEATAEETAGES